MAEQALFQDQDFAFYANSYLSLVGGEAGHVVNAWGTNLFGIFGFDGYPTLHHDIHFSLAKYGLALLGWATGSPFAIEVSFVALLVAGLALTGRQLDRQRPGAGSALLLLAVTHPSAVPFATFDLRVYILLLPAMLLLYTAIEATRPRWQLILAATLLASVREEALVLLLVAALHACARGQMRGVRDLLTIELLLLCATATYYFGLNGHEAEPPAVAVFLTLLAATGAIAFCARSEAGRARIAGLGAYVELLWALPFVGYYLVEILSGKNVVEILEPPFYPGIVFLLVWWCRTRPLPPRALALVLLVLVSASIGIGIDAVRDLRNVSAAVDIARAELPGPDAQHPWVVDSDSYQLFYREPVIVVDHLPRSLVDKDRQTRLPHSLPFLEAQLAGGGRAQLFLRAKTWNRLLELGELRLAERFEPRFFRLGRGLWGAPEEIADLSGISRRESRFVMVMARPRGDR